MDQLTQRDLAELFEAEQPYLVSIYMPAHRAAGRENQQDPLRLRNLLGEAEQRLRDRGLRSPEAQHLLEPVHELLGDPIFWQNQGDGLAVFFREAGIRFWRLPLEFRELVTVGKHFHLVPLLPLADDTTFYVLALSGDRVRLIEARRQSVQERRVPDMPEDLKDVTRFYQVEKQHGFHTRTGASPASSRRSGLSYGIGSEADEAEHKDRLIDFCRLIDRALGVVLAGSRTPLVLACDKTMMGIYGQCNSYAYMLPEAVLGNPDGRRPEELRDAAWKLVEPRIEENRAKLADSYGQAKARQQGSDRVEEILPAAMDGRIAALLLRLDRECWGRFDPDRREAEVHDSRRPSDDDLVNLSALLTYQHGGRLVPIAANKMPVDSPLAAMFRW